MKKEVKGLEKFIIIFIILCILVLLEIIRETHTFKVTHYEISSAKFNKNMKEKKIIMISDLHNCVYGKENKKLLTAVKNEHPDYIFVAGDVLIGDLESTLDIAEDFMKKAQKTAQVYYANGNHEQRMKELKEKYNGKYEKYKKELEENGIIFLENETVSLNWDGVKTDLTGLEIPLNYYTRFARKKLQLEEMEERIGKKDPNAYTVLFAHNPTHIETYADWKADLVLAGHLHGGVVRIPFSRGVITPQAVLFPKYSGGIYKVGDTTMVVSKGLGTHTIKVRLFNQCELVVLHMKGSK